MARKAVVTVGLGWGDECKGSCVDYLCHIMKADLVVRYSGGCQAAHHVVLPDGRSHCFSQFGSGTFAGCRTWLHKNMIIEPVSMENEAEHLKEIGIADPWSNLFIHPQCLITTPYHMAANRARELYREERGEGRHGSCGMGIGECREYAIKYPNLAVRAMDLFNPELLEFKLLAILRHYESQFGSEETSLLPYVVAERYAYIRSLMTITDKLTCETAVFEGSQGMLIDETFGTAPYNTWSDVTLRAAQDALQDLQIEKVFNLGITRTFATRHGPGPFPTEIAGATIKGDHNQHNKWQGAFRVGKLDLDSLSYAAKNVGAKLDGIALTWTDRQPAGCETDTDECIESIELATDTLVVMESHGPTNQDKTVSGGLVSDKLFRFAGIPAYAGGA